MQRVIMINVSLILINLFLLLLLFFLEKERKQSLKQAMTYIFKAPGKG